MSTNIIKKLAGTVALLTGGSRGIGAAIVKRLAADRADVASVFVTNGGYNGVQQVLRLSTPLSPSSIRLNYDKRLSQNGEND
jgi:short-subunit dehydrogenase